MRIIIILVTGMNNFILFLIYFLFFSVYCSVRQPPKRMLPPSVPISQPIRSPKFGLLPSPCTSQVYAKYDVLVWFEICELGNLIFYFISVYLFELSNFYFFIIVSLFLFNFTGQNGEYVPCVVDHSDDLPCRGLFLLHQGIQRRIRITIVHEHTAELQWKDIKELVVGKQILIF